MRRFAGHAVVCGLAALVMNGAGCRDATPSAPVAPTPDTQTTHAARPLPSVTWTFARHGSTQRALTLAELATIVPMQEVETDDPYYRKRKRFLALELIPVLTHAFEREVDALRRQSFVLRALDGYAVPISGERLLQGGAFLAVDDLDVPGFAPIGPQQVSPAPSYLVWVEPGQSDLDTHPRPWQLSRIEIAPIEVLYPHIAPTGLAADNAAWRGHHAFVEHCLKCHAINREGGRVGPDLNLPQSIVEYRPIAQIRAYIRDPATFRYGAMPAHPQLTDEDLDGLIAYFRAMAARKHNLPESAP